MLRSALLAQISPEVKDKISTAIRGSSEEKTALTEEPKKLKTFTLFPKLIPELRLQIWQAHLLSPRLITISAHSSTSPSQYNSSLASYPQPNTTQSLHIARHAPCALLSVNSEARHEALTHYSRAPPPDTVSQDRLPYHTQHKSSTTGFYRAPGEDVVYLKGCYYDSRWFRGVAVVGREIVPELAERFNLPLDSGIRSVSDAQGRPAVQDNRGGEIPLVGCIKTLALDEAFLSDETLFGRPEVSPVMVYLMRDLKRLQGLIVVRTEGEKTDVCEIEVRIEDGRRKLIRQCELWGYGEEVEELRKWKCPRLMVVGRRELGMMCGEFDKEMVVGN